MTLVLLLVLATILMSQVRVPQRWALVIVITVVLGASTLLPL